MTNNLETIRGQFINSRKRAYGALRVYAEALTEQFGGNWWMIPMKGPLASTHDAKIREAIREEKGLVQAAAEAAGLVNPYKPWSDVLKYVKGEEKKGANANAPRDIGERFVAELSKLYKAAMAQDELDPNMTQANWHVGAALAALGVDLSTLNNPEA